jgi:NNP family nitrate/nitrite transporter-like MFS transporter
MSDQWGARAVMYWVFGLSLGCCALLVVPQMDVRSPGSGLMAPAAGTVVSVSSEKIVVETEHRGTQTYPLVAKTGDLVTPQERREGNLVLPRVASWQEPVVAPGQPVQKKELLARGVTEIYFQANIWVFTALSLILGAVMGIGKAAVYKHIPDYFPHDVGVVGGIVGVIGGLGGFVCPVIFGYLLRETGLWTSCWMFFFLVVVVCLVWMHVVIRRMTVQKTPEVAHRIE